MESKRLISVLTFSEKHRDDNSTFYADPLLSNIFAIKALTQYKESIKEGRWGV